MKTMQELYDEILASDELKEAFVAAAKTNSALAFLKEHGCDVTAEDLQEFLAEKENEILALSENDLDTVAGGRRKQKTRFGSLLTSTCGQTNNCTQDSHCSCTCIEECC